MTILLQLALLCTIVWPQDTELKQGFAGLLQHIDITCSLVPNSQEEAGVFWMINGSVYGLLHIPGDFVVCRSDSCELDVLTIPVAQSEMDGYTFQCVGIDYHTKTLDLGRTTVLEVMHYHRVYLMQIVMLFANGNAVAGGWEGEG